MTERMNRVQIAMTRNRIGAGTVRCDSAEGHLWPFDGGPTWVEREPWHLPRMLFVRSDVAYVEAPDECWHIEASAGERVTQEAVEGCERPAVALCWRLWGWLGYEVTAESPTSTGRPLIWMTLTPPANRICPRCIERLRVKLGILRAA